MSSSEEQTRPLWEACHGLTLFSLEGSAALNFSFTLRQVSAHQPLSNTNVEIVPSTVSQTSIPVGQQWATLHHVKVITGANFRAYLLGLYRSQGRRPINDIDRVLNIQVNVPTSMLMVEVYGPFPGTSVEQPFNDIVQQRGTAANWDSLNSFSHVRLNVRDDQSYWNPAHGIPTTIQAGAGYRSDRGPRKPPSTAVLARSATRSGTAGLVVHAPKSQTSASKSLPRSINARRQAPLSGNDTSSVTLPSRATAGSKPKVPQRRPVSRPPAINAGIVSTTKRPVTYREATPQAVSIIRNRHSARVPNAVPLAAPTLTTVRSGRVLKKQNLFSGGGFRHAIAAA